MPQLLSCVCSVEATRPELLAGPPGQKSPRRLGSPSTSGVRVPRSHRMVRWSGTHKISLVLLPLVAACGSSIRNAAPTVASTPSVTIQAAAPEPEVVATPKPQPEDPVLALIDQSDR